MEANTATTDDAPVPDDIIDDVADEFDRDPETVRRVLDAFQGVVGHGIDLYREGMRVVAEDEETLVVLHERGYRDEIDALADFADGELDLSEDEWPDGELFDVISHAHHAAFKSANGRTLTGFTQQECVGALSASYPFVIGKPDGYGPDTGDLDAAFRIQYDHGYEKPFHFVARANATLSGEFGTLEIERTYRAIPDDMGTDEPRDEMQIHSEATHVESGTLVNDGNHSFALDEMPIYARGRINADNDDLRRWVYDKHTADFGVEYERVAEVVPICEECGAYPSDQIDVRQRPQLDGSPTLDNHCFAAWLGDHTALSQREAEVYALKHGRVSHREIGERLGVAKGTVDSMAARIKNKREEARITATAVPELR